MKQFESQSKDVPASPIDTSSSELSSEDDDLSTPASSVSSPLSSPGSPAESSDISAVIRHTISAGMEVDLDELLSIEDLSEIGMDSLMALTMLGTLREKAGLALPSDFFVENRSIKAIEQALHITAPSAAPNKKAALKSKRSHSSPKQIPPPQQTPEPPSSAPSTTRRMTKTPKVQLKDRQATSLLLQGNPKTATKSFCFFFYVWGST